MRRAGPGRSAVIVIAQLVGLAVGIATLLLTNALLGRILHSNEQVAALRSAIPLLVLLALVQAIGIGASALTAICKAWLLPRVHRQAEEDLYRAALAANLSRFDDPAFYDQLHRARERGVMHMEGGCQSLLDAGAAALSVLSATATLAYLQPLLVPMLLLSLLPNAWAALRATRLQYASMPRTIDLMRQTSMMGDIATDRSSAPEVRAHQTESYVLGEFSRAAVALQDHLASVGRRESLVLMTGRLLSLVALVLTFGLLGMLLSAHVVSVALAGTAVVAIAGASGELERLIQMTHSLFEKAVYVTEFDQLVNRAGRTATAAAVSVPPSAPTLVLHNVCYRYQAGEGPCSPADKESAIDGISLTIKAGQFVALVGANGSGKSTLAKLIAGLYQPTSGYISWNGVDLRDIAPEERADRIAMVLQDPVRWPRSARDNIRVGRSALTDSGDIGLRRAASQSRADEIVSGMRGGWGTLLSPEFRDGRDLSGGQWQRFAVARALYRDAPLIVWDEPTSSLDADTEATVHDTLRRLSGQRTVILITHHLASVQQADQIFVLDRGRLREQGSHAALMDARGKYAELYEIQTRFNSPVLADVMHETATGSERHARSAPSCQ